MVQVSIADRGIVDILMCVCVHEYADKDTFWERVKETFMNRSYDLLESFPIICIDYGLFD